MLQHIFAVDSPDVTAIEPWPRQNFEEPLKEAYTRLSDAELFNAFNGMFPVTPDKLP